MDGVVESSTGVGSPRGWPVRAKAASIHFGLSLAVVGTLAGLLAWLAFPGATLWAAGGATLILMIAGVDVVIGPLLTFIVFDPAKRELVRDLTVIAVIQVAALGYGLYASALGRPMFMTFVVDRFELLSAAEVDAEELRRAPQAFREHRGLGPRLAAARSPSDPAERDRVLLAGLRGIDLKHLLRYYIDYQDARQQVLTRARPIDELSRFNPPDRVERALSARSEREHLVFLPVQGSREDVTALIDRRDARMVAVVRLKPWE